MLRMLLLAIRHIKSQDVARAKKKAEAKVVKKKKK